MRYDVLVSIGDVILNVLDPGIQFFVIVLRKKECFLGKNFIVDDGRIKAMVFSRCSFMFCNIRVIVSRMSMRLRNFRVKQRAHFTSLPIEHLCTAVRQRLCTCNNRWERHIDQGREIALKLYAC